ncbi:MAG: DUF975 family protein [Clostridiales bacterium]|nr:DUF975 family protein [Clostridiales bacterium]
MLEKGQIRVNIKGMARRMLRGSWGMALLVMFIPVLISLGFSALQMSAAGMLMIDLHPFEEGFPTSVPSAQLMTYTIFNAVAAFLQFLVSAPIRFGIVAWFVRLTDGQRPTLSTVFTFFESGARYRKAVFAELLLLLRLFFWGMLLLGLPAAAVTYLAFDWLDLQQFMTFVLYVGAKGYRFETWTLLPLQSAALLGGLLLLSLLYMVVLMAYLPVRYLLVRDPERRLGELFRKSTGIMKGHKLEGLVFHVSFIGWLLLCILGEAVVLALLLLFLPEEVMLVATPWLNALTLQITMVYVRAGLVLFCEYVEDAARLAEGKPPYSVTPFDAQEREEGWWGAEGQPQPGITRIGEQPWGASRWEDGQGELPEADPPPT